MNPKPTTIEPSNAPKLVSIGVPIYKRLEYLPNVLNLVGAQDYPHVELVVSDNGENGSKVRDLVESRYRRLYRLRQNPATVNIAEHFNQIINEATGEYYVTLNDDDEISPNFVSELVQQMELHPEANVAFARQVTIDKEGVVLKSSSENLPDILSGAEFIRATWDRYEFGFSNLESFMAKRKPLKEAGGYTNFPGGNYSDDSAVIKVCLDNYVVFSSKCTYRHRIHEGGYGWNISMKELAAACRGFIAHLDSAPNVRRFAAAHPGEWRDLRASLVRMTWETYLWRWKDIYRDRMSGVRWVQAALAMPFRPLYYRRVISVLREAAKTRLKSLVLGESAKRPDFFVKSH
jgi:glycosyltransferase involved in cell wall biosynthesis